MKKELLKIKSAFDFLLKCVQHKDALKEATNNEINQLTEGSQALDDLLKRKWMKWEI